MNNSFNFNNIKRCGRFVLDYANFMKELPDSFSEIGAMLPSSPHLAKLMTEPLISNSSKSRILEVGPGTGPFTRSILKHFKHNDELVVCEINKRLMQGLKKSLSFDSYFITNADRVSFFEGSVLDLPLSLVEDKFDFIVCSLPFHNFSPEMVDTFFQYFMKILKDDGTITFFHYAGLKKLSGISPKKEVRDRVKGVDKIIAKWCSDASFNGTIRKKVTFLNLPPAVSITMSVTNAPERHKIAS